MAVLDRSQRRRQRLEHQWSICSMKVLTIFVLQIAKYLLCFHERIFASPVLWCPQVSKAAIGGVPTNIGGLREGRTEGTSPQEKGQNLQQPSARAQPSDSRWAGRGPSIWLTSSALPPALKHFIEGTCSEEESVFISGTLRMSPHL